MNRKDLIILAGAVALAALGSNARSQGTVSVSAMDINASIGSTYAPREGMQAPDRTTAAPAGSSDTVADDTQPVTGAWRGRTDVYRANPASRTNLGLQATSPTAASPADIPSLPRGPRGDTRLPDVPARDPASAR